MAELPKIEVAGKENPDTRILPGTGQKVLKGEILYNMDTDTIFVFSPDRDIKLSSYRKANRKERRLLITKFVRDINDKNRLPSYLF
uniref:Uncharacterized protein n=1 Tax=viral metagenome TaxID=1070528 RepID=A0A6M3ITF1_9ZZZZ